jgi:phosphoglycerate kinase
MQTVSSDLIKGKKVLLRFDIDVPVESGRVVDDFRLQAGLPTLKLCLENASEVIILGHIGRPKGEDKELSVSAIYGWLSENGFEEDLQSGKLRILENLRFEQGEDSADIEYAKELARFGEVYVNEAFAAHHKAASTTVLPTMMPHAAGLNFSKEVAKLQEIRENPKRPLVAIIGGAKLDDKLPAVQALSKIADTVLVGGKVAAEIRNNSVSIPHNVLIARLNSDGEDVSEESIKMWRMIISQAKQIIWNGPLGKVDSTENSKGTFEVARIVAESGADSIVGGGDTVAALDNMGMLSKFGFASTGGGAMLEYIIKGTLPTIEALDG